MKKLLSVLLALAASASLTALAAPVLDVAEDAYGNEGVTYEVVEETNDESVAELAAVSELKWDFETPASQTWSNRRFNTTYKNGMMILDSSVIESSNNYINHSAVPSGSIVDAATLKYLVLNLRSVGNVKTVGFYFKTSGCSWSEANKTNISIIPNSDNFDEYVVDLSAYSGWTGNYEGCMLQLTSSTGTGIVEVEEIKFVSEYVPEDELYHEFHVDITNPDKFKAWGHTGVKVNEDGTVNFGKYVKYVEDAAKGTYYYDEATDSYLPITADTTLPEGAKKYSINNQGAAYIYPNAALNASHYNKLVVKAKGGNVDSVKTYYSTTGSAGYTEAKTMSVGPAEGADGFTYYIFDYSTRSDFSGVVKEFMVTLNNYGETVVHDIYFTNDATVAVDLKPYVFDFEGLSTVDEGKTAGLSAWNGHTSISFDGECMVITRSNAGGSGGIDVKPQKTLVAANYPYLIAKVRKPENGATISFNTYYVTGSMTGIAGGKEVKATKVNVADDNYDYYLTDFSTSSAYANGNLKFVVFTTGTAGTWYVEDLIFANDLTLLGVEKDVPDERAVKTYLNYDAKIEEENGTSAFEPFILYADGSEEEDYSATTYVADSDNATVTKNEDGTATVTAKLNGTVNVTVTLPGEVTYTKTVEISGQAPVRTVVYDANTTDEVTGMPEAVTVQTWDSTFTVSDAKPERAGYKFAGWGSKNADYVLDACAYNGDTTTMYASWIDENAGLFRINADEFGEVSLYVNGNWRNHSDCKYYGGSYIVPLTDGVGYVLVSDTADIENVTVYKVTADACEELDYVPAKTLAEKEARAKGDTGIRFKASVAHKMRNEGNIAEYGFVVSTANQISDGDNLNLHLVESGNAVKGIAYSKADSIDKYVDETDEGVIMAAVLTGVKADKKSYTTKIYVKPYMILDSDLEVYGLATSTTYYDVAKAIAENMPEDAPYASYINGIISTVEAE